MWADAHLVGTPILYRSKCRREIDGMPAGSWFLVGVSRFVIQDPDFGRVECRTVSTHRQRFCGFVL